MAVSPARLIVFSFGLASLLLVPCRAAVAAQDNAVLFGYGKGQNGPDHWGTLNPEWKICNSGSKQSPIDIVKDDAKLTSTLEPLTRVYADAKATLVNNGFNIMLRYEEGVGTALVEGKNYSLQQVHWHSPSEHTLDGERFPLEMHMVHKTSNNKLAVVAVLYRLGGADKFIKQFMEKLKELAKQKCGDKEEAQVPVGVVENKLLKRGTRKYYRYVGSLTAPPCTEEVVWTILGKIRKITQDQLDALQAPLSAEYRNNSRPLEPLKGRTVTLYKKSKDKENKKDKDDKDNDKGGKDDDDKDERKKDDNSKKDKPKSL